MVNSQYEKKIIFFQTFKIVTNELNNCFRKEKKLKINFAECKKDRLSRLFFVLIGTQCSDTH
jgi:hypothetical protein